MVDEVRVREMLRRRAGDVSAPAEAPPGMLRRAWRRILMTFAGSAVVIALVATGAAAGLRAIDRAGRARGGWRSPGPGQRPLASVQRPNIRLDAPGGPLGATIVRADPHDSRPA